MARFDLTDFEWSVIQPLLPNKPRGFRGVDDRRVLNGIFWRLRTGAPCADIPERYGPYTTCVNRFNRWRRAGVWDRLLEAVSLPSTCWPRSGKATSCSAMLPTISMSCAKIWRRAAPGPASSPCPIAAACQPSRHSSIATATWSSASSTNSSIFERSQRAMTRHQKTSSQLSSLPQ